KRDWSSDLSSSLTSHLKKRASPPFSSINRTVSLPESSSTSDTITFAPAFENAKALPLPIPEPAAVTSPALPSINNVIFIPPNLRVEYTVHHSLLTIPYMNKFKRKLQLD